MFLRHFLMNFGQSMRTVCGHVLWHFRWFVSTVVGPICARVSCLSHFRSFPSQLLGARNCTARVLVVSAMRFGCVVRSCVAPSILTGHIRHKSLCLRSSVGPSWSSSAMCVGPSWSSSAIMCAFSPLAPRVLPSLPSRWSVWLEGTVTFAFLCLFFFRCDGSSRVAIHADGSHKSSFHLHVRRFDIFSRGVRSVHRCSPRFALSSR